MKVTKTVEKKFGKQFTKFFVDGVLVAECRQYKEFYCTVDKSGRPSRVRDKVKTAKETRWESEGLVKLLGEDVKKEILFTNRTLGDGLFRDDYPHLTWGYTGSVLSPKKIKDLFNQYKNEKK